MRILDVVQGNLDDVARTHSLLFQEMLPKQFVQQKTLAATTYACDDLYKAIIFAGN